MNMRRLPDAFDDAVPLEKRDVTMFTLRLRRAYFLTG